MLMGWAINSEIAKSITCTMVKFHTNLQSICTEPKPVF